MSLAAVLRGLLCLYVVALATTMSGMELFSSLLCLLFLFDPDSRNLVRRHPPQFWKPALAFMVVVGVGIFLGESTLSDKWYDLRRLRFFFLYAVIFYCVANYGRDRRWLSFLAVTTTIVGVYGFVQHFVAIDLLRPEGRKVLLYALQDQKIGPLVVGTFNHHLTFSNIYLLFACLFTAIGLHRWPRQKWPLLLGGFQFLLCFWTQSRVGWVAISAVLLILAFARDWKLGLATLGLGIVALGIFFFTDSGFRSRLTHTFVPGQQKELYLLGERQKLWIAQWHIFKAHPLLGIGWNNNERHAKRYVDELFPGQSNFYGHAHSTPLQILATTGILGSLAYAWLWLSILLHSLRIAKRGAGEDRWWGWGLFAAFIGFQIQGLTQWNFGDAEVLHNVVFFWAVTANMSVVVPTSSGYN